MVAGPPGAIASLREVKKRGPLTETLSLQTRNTGRSPQCVLTHFPLLAGGFNRRRPAFHHSPAVSTVGGRFTAG